MSIRYMKKCSTVYKCKGNTNQRHNEISSHTYKNGYYFKKKITKVGEDVEKLEPLCIIGRNANSTTTMVNCIEVLQKIKNRTTI